MSDSLRLFARCPKRVRIIEVGPRDGLQNEARAVPTAQKVAFVEALAAAELKYIEVSSFVSPERVPQLADAAEVFAELHCRPDVVYSALVPNVMGLERALRSSVNAIAVPTAASETFCLKNLGCGVAASLERAAEVTRLARTRGVHVRAYVSTAFVCPYEGTIPAATADFVVRRLEDLGIDDISIADTLGAAFPHAVDELLALIRERRPLSGIALHLHDTYGRGTSNALVGLLHGVEAFDSSAGGLGGCPFAPGASGNLATEVLVDFLRGMGIETGVDAAAVRQAAAPFIAVPRTRGSSH